MQLISLSFWLTTETFELKSFNALTYYKKCLKDFTSVQEMLIFCGGKIINMMVINLRALKIFEGPGDNIQVAFFLSSRESTRSEVQRRGTNKTNRLTFKTALRI